MAFVVFVFSAGAASATTLGFSPVKCTKSASECATLGSQLSVELLPSTPGKVSFVLHNVGSESITATSIFFDDAAGVLADLFDVTDPAGVDFAESDKPKNLKSGKKIDFFADFIASAAKPTKDNGVNPGDSVQINFVLASGQTLEDVQEALDSGSLRVGVNAKQGFVTASGVVPEPSTLMLFALGGFAAAWAARRS
jgi:PEP-CTERM motif